MIRSTSFLLLCSFAAATSPCLADIYGYVDDQGATYLSSTPLDSRYNLWIKEPPENSSNDSTAAPAPRDAVRGSSNAGELRRRYASLVSQIAREQKVDEALLHAVIAVESGYNARAKSRKGASGLMQLMPHTAQRYGVTDVWNPADNIRAGARHLRDLLGMFDDNINLALAAYNAGAGAVIESGNKIPPYPETRMYVPRVLENYERFRKSSL
jgi:soluble lytic murein transglycosylase-like protein